MYDWYTITEIIATNEQYVPLGHKNAVPVPEPSKSPTSPVTTEPTKPATSEHTNISKPTFNYIIVAVLTVTVVIFATGSFFYFKKITQHDPKSFFHVDCFFHKRIIYSRI
jgi:hypothetical protein